MRKPQTTIAEQAKAARAAERRYRAANDPYFGRRRKAGQMSGTTKASASRDACRGRVSA